MLLNKSLKTPSHVFRNLLKVKMKFELCGMLEIWYVGNLGCRGCGMFGIWHFPDVRMIYFNKQETVLAGKAYTVSEVFTHG